MLYKPFGQQGPNVSLFGVGAMRLPVISSPLDPDKKIINREISIPMIHTAIDRGVNYIDTAWPYHGEDSEPFLAEALKGGLREKIHLATKLPSWLIKEKADLDKFLNAQLERLETDYIDFYLLHALSHERWANLKSLGVLEWLDSAVADGRIRNPGFSYHDDDALFKEIIDAYDWKMCQIQLNYMDTEHQQGIEGLKYAGAKGIPVVIMEPLKGGVLATKVPGALEIMESYPEKRSAVEWAFRFLTAQEETNVILSGVSTPEQLFNNLDIFDSISTEPLIESEEKIFRTLKTFFKERTHVDCTACGYCMPCPAGVNIPDVFSIWNNAGRYDDLETYSGHYKWALLDNEKGGNMCVSCGECLEKCPQKIEIPEKLAEAHEQMVARPLE